MAGALEQALADRDEVQKALRSLYTLTLLHAHSTKDLDRLSLMVGDWLSVANMATLIQEMDTLKTNLNNCTSVIDVRRLVGL
jgi:hypothetical protein